jgi:glutamate--cysteine ligase
MQRMNNSTYERRLHALDQAGAGPLLRGSLMGLEKEGLRVAPDGTIATTPHPAKLGSALTHPHITTDFSEALLELVTPALDDAAAVLDLLRDLHLFCYRHLGDELIWGASMPCIIGGGASVPLARYGTSNAATMKTVYRRGLGNRYGRVMQTIAGVHFNFSVAEGLWPLLADLEDTGGEPLAFRSDRYMGLVRNLQRIGWLVPYLFGASPAVCRSFVANRPTDLVAFDSNTLYHPYATSLRMGDIGYQNRQEEGTGMKASYDSLDAYIRSLTWAIETPCPLYEQIGVKVGNRWEQLNDHVLQIENEYYSTVRPKQLTDWMERPTLALRRRGIAYIELRSLDVNAFDPLGIDAEQMRFLCCLMLYCLLSESPRIDARERRLIDGNEVLAAHRGREPGLRLEHATDGLVPLTQWADTVLDQVLGIAELLDGYTDGPHAAAVRAQQAKIANPELTPSARMLAAMRDADQGFATFACRLSEQHRDWFRAQPLDPGRNAWLEALTARSHRRQARIEAADQIDFDEFMRRYFAQSEHRPVELHPPA